MFRQARKKIASELDQETHMIPKIRKQKPSPIPSTIPYLHNTSNLNSLSVLSVQHSSQDAAQA